MNDNLTEILKSIPDFEDLLSLVNQIRELSFKKLLLEKEIKEKESEVFRTMTSDKNYLVNGKSPSTSFIENTYKHSGLSGEILPIREEYSKVTVDLDRCKMTMDVYKNMISVFQTLSANER